MAPGTPIGGTPDFFFAQNVEGDPPVYFIEKKIKKKTQSKALGTTAKIFQKNILRILVFRIWFGNHSPHGRKTMVFLEGLSVSHLFVCWLVQYLKYFVSYDWPKANIPRFCSQIPRFCSQTKVPLQV